MTRINLVPPEELCDEHLRAEFREITRIPNAVLKGKYSLEGQPKAYTVRTEDNPEGGKGHVKFFLDKLQFIGERYFKLLDEMRRRGFKITYSWPDTFSLPEVVLNNYKPTPEALALNRKRIQERWPKRAHYRGVLVKTENNQC